MTESAAALPVDPSQMGAEIDRAVELCGGDPRATIAALLADVHLLQKERNLASGLVGASFASGWFTDRAERMRKVARSAKWPALAKREPTS